MTVKTYSKAANGTKKLSANFTVKEFACQDGSDKILIDDGMVRLLQLVRDQFGKPVIITSGYRTAAHNKKVGGTSASQHLYGKAVDFYINGVPMLEIAQCCERMGFYGIGLYEGWVHADVRDKKYFWDQQSGTARWVSTFGEAKIVDTNYTKVQEAAGLSDDTMAYLQKYKYGDDLLEKLAAAMK